jgi:hypothetical protein
MTPLFAMASEWRLTHRVNPRPHVLLDTRDVTRVLASCDGITITVLPYGWAAMHCFSGRSGSSEKCPRLRGTMP